MYVTLVHIHVRPENLDDFIEATLCNAEESTREPGNLRFDVLQSAEDACRFVLYEAYESADDAAAHKGTLHYQRWRDTVTDWMVEPRQGVTYRGLSRGALGD